LRFNQGRSVQAHVRSRKVTASRVHERRPPCSIVRSMDVDWARTLAVYGVVVLTVAAIVIGYRWLRR
jgi:hypothetical protein